MMSSWRAAFGVGTLLSVVAACGDDAEPSKPTGTEAAAAGQSSEPGMGGNPSMLPSGGAGTSGGAATAGAGGTGLTSVDVVTYCKLLADVHGEWLRHCYGPTQYPDAAAAALTASERRDCSMSESSVDEGRLAFDEEAALACLSALDTANCDGFDFIAGVPECQAVFTPVAEVGDDCYVDATRSILLGTTSECRDGYCDVTGQTCPGTCTAFKADAQPCATSAECAPESYCGEDGCTPRKGAFGDCSGDTCLPGMTCVYPLEATDGICMTRSTDGQSCSSDEPCSLGFYCIDEQCRSKVETGERCELSLNCPADERCLDRDGTGPTCGPPGGDGVPCREAKDCVASHHCPISAPRVCSPRATVGEACTNGQCEIGTWCNSEIGQCQAPGNEDDSCLVGGSLAGPEACALGLHCMGDGACHAPGEEGDPCHPSRDDTCSRGLFCSRADFTCQELAAEGALCNPFASVSCTGTLRCVCNDPACDPDSADPMREDSLHACAPARAPGESCFRDEECATGSSCLGGALGTCTAPLADCVPE